MFGHLPELFIILVIALIVFGPEKLPEMAASAGKMMREVRAIADEVMHPVRDAIPDDFSTYYYESLARSGEDEPGSEKETSEMDSHEIDAAESGTGAVPLTKETVQAHEADAEITPDPAKVAVPAEETPAARPETPPL